METNFWCFYLTEIICSKHHTAQDWVCDCDCCFAFPSLSQSLFSHFTTDRQALILPQGYLGVQRPGSVQTESVTGGKATGLMISLQRPECFNQLLLWAAATSKPYLVWKTLDNLLLLHLL